MTDEELAARFGVLLFLYEARYNPKTKTAYIARRGVVDATKERLLFCDLSKVQGEVNLGEHYIHRDEQGGPILEGTGLFRTNAEAVDDFIQRAAKVTAEAREKLHDAYSMEEAARNLLEPPPDDNLPFTV